MHTSTPSNPPRPAHRAQSWLLPAAATVLLHGGAFWMLYSSWSPEPPASAPPSVMVMQLVTLPHPAPEPPAPPIIKPEPLPEPVVEAAPPAPPEPQVDQAEIARKRLAEQQQREREEQQRLAEQRQRQEREQEQERQRQQARAQQEQQQREAEQRAQAEQQRLAAEAARRAAEAAAIAQYQPISKKPPAYPRRALDRGLEGDCTVTYTVTEEGRVRDPEVVEGACDDPLFVRPSLAAAKSFRYQPRTVNGERVAVADVRNTFRYRIQ